MTESDLIKSTPEPRTRASLANDMSTLGLEEGMLVLVHSSMNSLGWINGGPVAVIQALQDVITARGTLVMPAHSADLSDPAKWENPPIPEDWWETIRATMPAYDPERTPTRGVGTIPELFRTWPDVLRSDHPAHSFAAWGRLAEEITSGHPLAFGFGPGSPLDKIFTREGYVLLLGVGYDSNTSFHLAEYRLDWMARASCSSPIQQMQGPAWQSYEDVDLDTDDFTSIGEAFEKLHRVEIGKVGSATSRLFSQPLAVDFAEKWMHSNREYPSNT